MKSTITPISWKEAERFYRRSAFGTLIAEDIPRKYRQRPSAAFLMQVRDTGINGFFGGAAEENGSSPADEICAMAHAVLLETSTLQSLMQPSEYSIPETLEQTFRREFEEETSIALGGVTLQPLCAHKIYNEGRGWRSSGFFVGKVPFDFLLEVINAVTAHMKVDFHETMGAFFVPARFYKTTHFGLPAVMASQMPAGAGEQILCMLETLKLASGDQIETLRNIHAWRQTMPGFTKPNP